MRRAPKCALLGLLCAGGLFSPVVPAQDLAFDFRDREGVPCSIQVTTYAGRPSGGGFGFFHVVMENRDRSAHELEIEIRLNDWSNGIGSSVGRRLELGPGESGAFFLPLPAARSGGLECEASFDGRSLSSYARAPQRSGRTALLLSPQPASEPRMLALAQVLWPPTKGSKTAVARCDPRQAPPDWRLYTAFDLVVVDGRGQLDRSRQEAVRRFVHAGGRLVACDADRMPPGALEQMLHGAAIGETVRHGMGRIAVAPRLSTDPEAMLETMPSWVGSPGIWPIPEMLQRTQSIPGLDEPPVGLFLFVILAFAVLVGPVNFLVLRIWGRPMLALVTVPALGLGTTALMVLFGLLHDGLGARGVERSWSLLDQREHEVAALAARTLFAGMSVAGLEMGSDSLLLAPQSFFRDSRRSRHRWTYSADTGLIGSAVLPARTPTVLVSARQGPARARLRARARDGELELLTDGGVVPAGKVLLRDFDGQYWIGRGRRLVRCDREGALAAIEEFGRRITRMDPGPNGGKGIPPFTSLAVGLLPGEGLAPGSYVTRTASPSWLPRHGLEADYEGEEHLLVGYLAAEDFVR